MSHHLFPIGADSKGGIDALDLDLSILRPDLVECPYLARWCLSSLSSEFRADKQLSWAFTIKAATKIQLINESLGLMFNCSNGEITSGACVAQSGDQLYAFISSSSSSELMFSLALFGWNDLSTAKFTGIMVATAIGWRVVAWACLCIKVRGFR
jgi:hypothetical protein